MAIHWVKKDSGHYQKFSFQKLHRSIAAALAHAGNHNKQLAERLAHEILEYLEAKNIELIDVDAIRQAALHVLKHDKESQGANAYEMLSLHIKEVEIAEVLKRNGSREKFHPHKLFKSLKKSFSDAGLEGAKLSEELTKEIIAKLEIQYHKKAIPVMEIRKIASQLLREKGLGKVERSYLLHKYL